ncbi:MAG: hypothetical protein M3Y41_14545 [Pseudomonadota bacterium]|nr:hypothetical protein [Pseudomonadota bacterium]
MAPRTKTLAGTWRGPKAETFTTITWQSANRARHESDYPDRPGFTAAELADWSRIFKRVDAEHPKPGKNSFQALVGRQLVGTDLVIRTAVYFVAYTKSHGIIEVVSIRFADSQERAVFFGQATWPPHSG